MDLCPNASARPNWPDFGLQFVTSVSDGSPRMDGPFHLLESCPMPAPRSLTRTGLLGLCAATLALGALSTAGAAEPAAKKPAKAAAALPDLSPEQLANAERVLTGNADCEFNQSVAVQPHAQKAGYFKVDHKGKSYVMAPEPTTTGAVRLEDKKNGLVWLQIANKSMLMNAKAGRRMVDNCVHPSQKT